MKTECIRYHVDPNLLRTGVPVEDLAKKNAHSFSPDEKRNYFNNYRKYNSAFYLEKTKESD